MDNQYTIINIDPILKAVYAEFSYNGHFLNEAIFVSDVTDANGITLAVDTVYANFTTQMDALDAISQQITPAVQSLIGSVQTQDQVNQALGIMPVTEPPIPLPPQLGN